MRMTKDRKRVFIEQLRRDGVVNRAAPRSQNFMTPWAMSLASRREILTPCRS